MSVVALIPAAGEASRLGPLPCSKEILPLGTGNADAPVPSVMCDHVLDAFAAAGVRRVFVVVREGKWDIPAHYSQWPRDEVAIAYLVTSKTPGCPYTLDKAFPFLGDARVVLGFPDILFQPVNAYSAILDHQQHCGADVVLGLFPASEPRRMDMVCTDRQGNVLEILIKPPSTKLTMTWAVAVWTASFTRFMHDYLQQVRTSVLDDRFPAPGASREIHVGDVFISAIAAGLKISSVSFNEGRCLDVGTPESWARVGRGVPVALRSARCVHNAQHLDQAFEPDPA